MRVAFLTAGDPNRLTGGYLYHARVFETLRGQGVAIDQIVVTADPSLAGQRAAAPDAVRLTARGMAADVIVIDALAVVACRLQIADWQAARPVVAMVHELPSVAGEVVDDDLLAAETRLLKSDLVVAVSRHGAGILAARGVPAERMRVVPPGSDRVGARPATRRRSNDPLRALAVAQWIPRKGIDTLVDAWARLRPTDAVLELIGETSADPAYEARVRERIAATQQATIVRGTVDDAALADAYANADLFVLPSRYEGYGMVYAEALLHGLPIIACNVGPVPELLGPGAALLVPPGDAAALTRALNRLLADAATRERMAAAAARRGRSLPTWADTAAHFKAVLTAAIASRSR